MTILIPVKISNQCSLRNNKNLFEKFENELYEEKFGLQKVIILTEKVYEFIS